jgi:hypothetical protein
MWKNTVAIYNISKEKNYKVQFLTSSIFKKKNKQKKFWKKNKWKKRKKRKVGKKRESNFGKKNKKKEIKKKIKRESWNKKNMKKCKKNVKKKERGMHCGALGVREQWFPHTLYFYLKNKKIKNKNYVEKHRSNPRYFKEKNYKVRFLTSSIFK